MIKQIICPVDFSPEAENAALYAAQFAASVGAVVSYVNVQRLMPRVAAIAAHDDSGKHTVENVQSAHKKLSHLCETMAKSYGVKADFEVDVTTRSFENLFSLPDPEKTLIIFGTNGIDDLYQYFFGTNAYQVAKKTKCPVLVIPSGTTYQEIKNVVFAWDYSNSGKQSFSSLTRLMKPFKPQYTLLHVSKHKQQTSRDVFNAFREEINESLGEDADIECVQEFSDDIPATLSKYVNSHKVQFLAVTFYERGIIGSMFHGTIVRDLSEASVFPVLILHN